MTVWRRGNRIAPIPETAAQGRVQEIYAELRQAFGLPLVGLVHQTFAAFPDFLDLHWRVFRPVAETQQFFDVAERLRADAYTRIFTYLDVADLSFAVQDAPARRELLQATELWQYADPLLLLMVAAQYQAFEGPVGAPTKPNLVPPRHPIFDELPPRVDERHPPAEARAALDAMRRTFGEPLIAPDYLMLASWPGFFSAYWSALKTCMQSPLYEGCRHVTRETAWMLARELPGPIELTFDLLLELGIPDDDISSVVHITEMFIDSLSRTLLDTAIARIGLEGGTRSYAPKPSDTAQPPQNERAA